METNSQSEERSIGETLRGLRRKANLTLEATARQADVTKGYLSKVERGASIPSIAVVGRLAEVFGIEMADVFHAPAQKGPFSLVRASERRSINRNGSEYGYTYEIVPLNKANPRSEIFFLTLPCIDHSILPRLRHPGEEILVMLEGRIRFEFAGAVFMLEEGDIIQFDASYEHLGVAVDGKDARAMLVITQHGSDAPKKGNGAAE
jgi:transcriptional regulator with XRE-family HTH domain